MKHTNNHTETLILTAKQGRVYNLGTMTAIFKADENETAEKYSVSEWWLKPNSNGPGAHQHEDQDQIFLSAGRHYFHSYWGQMDRR